MHPASARLRPLIAPTANRPLEDALRRKLFLRSGRIGGLGELEPLALQIGLVQNSLKPAFHWPQLVVFAGDHGLAVDLADPAGPTTADMVQQLLQGRAPLTAFARAQGLDVSVVDSGMSAAMAPHPRLLARKIAHGTRNARAGGAMSQDQVEAGVRAGMEISAALPGNVVACAGIGVGSHESAALLLSRLTGEELASLLSVTPGTIAGPDRPHALQALQAASSRHADASDPWAVLAAFGGFEMAMLVGVMLSAASRRQLILVDGMPAFAALLLASRIHPAVPDYCIHCRSHGHPGLDVALKLLRATALLELGIESVDGTGAALVWPLVRSAAAALDDAAEADRTADGHRTDDKDQTA